MHWKFSSLTKLDRVDNVYWRCEYLGGLEYGMMLNFRSLDTAGTEQFSKSPSPPQISISTHVRSKLTTLKRQ